MFSGKVALVTGASSGIGASIAMALARSNMKVIGVAKNIKPIQEMKVDSNCGSILPMSCDITKEEDVSAMFKDIRKLYGGVDVCVNNAGMSFCSTLLDGSPKEWNEMLNVNLVALLHCSKLAFESMRERKVGGHIINISSVVAHNPNAPPLAHFYTATKLAVNYVTEGLRRELIHYNPRIKVACISPGTTKTNFFYTMFGEGAKDMESYEHMLNPSDVTRSLLHVLTSPDTTEINDIIIRPVGHEV